MAPRLHRRTFRLIAATALGLALEAHVAVDLAWAGAQRPIIGDWCGVDEYVISVGPDAINFRARRGYYSPPAFDVVVAEDHAAYSQRYESLEVTVSCTLSLQGEEQALENCDNPADSFYPKAGEIAELHRCFPKPEPSV